MYVEKGSDRSSGVSYGADISLKGSADDVPLGVV